MDTETQATNDAPEKTDDAPAVSGGTVGRNAETFRVWALVTAVLAALIQVAGAVMLVDIIQTYEMWSSAPLVNVLRGHIGIIATMILFIVYVSSLSGKKSTRLLGYSAAVLVVNEALWAVSRISSVILDIGSMGLTVEPQSLAIVNLTINIFICAIFCVIALKYIYHKTNINIRLLPLIAVALKFVAIQEYLFTLSFTNVSWWTVFVNMCYSLYLVPFLLIITFNPSPPEFKRA